ncbi:MAG: hypothetical protein IBJ17_17840, partial [Reyranella sp.]|nr:hypothetical protein [Reyranella sp.]
MLRKFVFSLILTALLVVAFEIGSAVFLYHAHQDRLSAQSADAPHWSATVGAIQTGLQTLLPERFPDAQRSRRMERLPAGFFSPDEAQCYRANTGSYIFRYSARRGANRSTSATKVTTTPHAPASPCPGPPEPRIR